MITLSVKWKRDRPLKSVIGKCRQCGHKQVFALEPEDQEFSEWVSFCMHCDGAAVFEKSRRQES